MPNIEGGRPSRLLRQVRVVLCRPRYGGNIGAAARAVKNMGLGELALVAPGEYHVSESRMFAASAKDVLEAARTFDTLEEALRDQEIVLGTSRRVKSGRSRIMTPREASSHLLGHLGSVGGSGMASLVFGPEDCGLTSEELALCHAVVSIPVDGEYASLNLAQSVMVMAYELRMGADDLPLVRSFGDASSVEISQMIEQMTSVLERSGFFIRNPRERALLHLKEILNHGVKTSQDARIVRGVFRRIVWALEGGKSAKNTGSGEKQ
ncbi:MAG: RNA methyltransferase [bacterium]|nr:RNA methyltransferase [bacterium]